MKHNSLFWIISIQFFCLLLENVKTYHLCQLRLHNKMPYCGCLKQQIFLFSQFWRLKGLRPRSWMIWFLLRAPCWLAPLSCVLIWQNKSSSSKIQTHLDLRRQWQPTPVLLPGKSSTLAWMEEPGRLQSTGSQGVGQDWVTSLSCIGRRKWQPTPVFLPGESQGRGSLVGCHLRGRTGSETTEAT